MDAKIVGFLFGPVALMTLYCFILLRSVVAALLVGCFGLSYHRFVPCGDSTGCAHGIKRCLKWTWDRETDCWDFLYHSLFGYLQEYREPLMADQEKQHASFCRLLILLLLSPVFITLGVFGPGIACLLISVGNFPTNWWSWNKFWCNLFKDAPCCCCPVMYFLCLLGPVDAAARMMCSLAFGCGIGAVSLIVGLAKADHRVVILCLRRYVARFSRNSWMNPGIQFNQCCTARADEECSDNQSRRASGACEPLPPPGADAESRQDSPPAYSEAEYSDALLPEYDELQPPPSYAASMSAGVIAAATAGIDVQRTDVVWEAFFDRCGEEARAAIANNWIAREELSNFHENVFSGLPALCLLQCLLEAASVRPNQDIEKAASVPDVTAFCPISWPVAQVGLEALHLSNGVLVTWRGSSHPLCNHFFAAAAG